MKLTSASDNIGAVKKKPWIFRWQGDSTHIDTTRSWTLADLFCMVNIYIYTYSVKAFRGNQNHKHTVDNSLYKYLKSDANQFSYDGRG